MRKQLMIPALLAMSVALAACATKPNPNLEQARSNFTALQTNPEATKVAALETKDASEWLAKAEQAFRNDDDIESSRSSNGNGSNSGTPSQSANDAAAAAAAARANEAQQRGEVRTRETR